MDLVNGLRLDSIEPADELDEAVKGAVRDGSQSAGLGTGEKLCQLRTERLGKGQIGNRDGAIRSSVRSILHLVCGLVICYYIKTMTLRFSRLKQQTYYPLFVWV